MFSSKEKGKDYIRHDMHVGHSDMYREKKEEEKEKPYFNLPLSILVKYKYLKDKFTS